MAIHAHHRQLRRGLLALERQNLALGGDAVEHVHDQAAERLAVLGVLGREADELHEVAHGHAAVDHHGIVGELLHQLVVGMAVLIVDVAHDLLHDVGHGDDAGSAAVLVDHHGDLRGALLQHLQQLRHGDALGHGLDGAHGQIVDGGALLHQVQILHVHEAHDAVLGLAAHGVARILVARDQRHVLFQRILKVDAHQIGSRGHDGLGVLVAQVEDVVHELVLLGVDETAFRGLVDEQLDLVARVHLALVGRVMAGQAHHAVGDAVEQDHDGVSDLVERHKRTSREQRIALGGEDGERLGDQLAHHHVQRGHDEIADGHGHHANQGLGQVQHLEQRTDKSRERGLAQPAQSQRR